MEEDEGYEEGHHAGLSHSARLELVRSLVASNHAHLVERGGVDRLLDASIAHSDLSEAQLTQLTLDPQQRSDLAYLLMLSLPTPALSDLQARISPLMNFDLLALLPPELCRCVLSQLDLRDALNASLVSKAWRTRVWDDQLLWRTLYERRGWQYEEAAVKWWNEHMPAAVMTPFNRSSMHDLDEGMAIDDLPAAQTLLCPPSSQEDHSMMMEGTSARPFSPGLPPSPRHVNHPALHASTQDGTVPLEEQRFKRWLPEYEAPSLQDPPSTRPKRFASVTQPMKRSSKGFQGSIGMYGPSQCVPDGFDISRVSRVHFDDEGRPWVNWRHLYFCRLTLDRNWRHGNFVMHEMQTPHLRYPAKGPPPPVEPPLNAHYPEGVYALQFDGDRLVAGLRPGVAVRYDLRTGEIVKRYCFHTGSVLCLQYDTADTHFERTPERLVTGSSDGHAVIWDFETGRLLHDLHSVLSVRFCGNTLATCSKDRTIAIWDMSSGKHLRSLVGHRSAVNAIALKNGLVVSASGDRDVRIWSAESGECLRTFTGHLGGIAALAFDGITAATGSSDSSVRLMDIESGEIEVEIGTPVEQAARDAPILPARFPPGAPMLLYAAESSAGLPPLYGQAHTELVRTLAFDSRFIVTGSYDESIRVWDRQTGLMILDIHAHSTRVFNLQFDISRIISCSQAGVEEIRIFDFLPGEDVSFLKA